MPLQLNVKMEIPGKPPREFLYDFDQDVVTFGRDSNNDIQIPLTTVSRRHARIIAEGNEYFIEDLGSTHGTVHNNKPLGQKGKKLLRDGDIVQIMHFQIQYRRAAAQPLEFGGGERTEQLARRMVQEVLASIGDAGDQPYLRVMNGPDEGKRFELSDAIAEVVIGRSSESDLVINDANISRRHAIVRKDWGGITIEDLGSKNGVVINEKKIDGPTAIQDSDEIMLGAVRLTFIDPTASFLGKLDGIPAFEDQATVGADGLDLAEGDDDDPDQDDEDTDDEDDDDDDDDNDDDDDDDEEEDDFVPSLGDDEDSKDDSDDESGAPGGSDVDNPEDRSGEELSDAVAPAAELAGVGKSEIIILVVVIVLVVGLAGGLAAFLLMD